MAAPSRSARARSAKLGQARPLPVVAEAGEPVLPTGKRETGLAGVKDGQVSLPSPWSSRTLPHRAR